MARTMHAVVGQAGMQKASRTPRLAGLNVDDGTGQRPCDPLKGLDAPGDQPAELVDVVCLGAHDDVIGAGHVLRLGHPADPRDLLGHLGGLADLRLDEDVRPNHDALPGWYATWRFARTSH